MISSSASTAMTCDGMTHRLKTLIGQLGNIPADRMDDEDRAAQRDMLHWSRCYQQRVRAIRISVTGSAGIEKVTHNPNHLNAALDEVRRYCDQVASMVAAGMSQTS